MLHGFVGVTISLLDSVNITEGENRTISIHLNPSAEREVPVMLRVLLRSAFSSMCALLYIVIPYLLHTTALYLIDESDIRAVTMPTDYFSPGMMYLSVLIEAIEDQIAEDTEVFDVVVEAVNPLDSVSSQNTSTVYILDNDGNRLYVTMSGSQHNICIVI